MSSTKAPSSCMPVLRRLSVCRHSSVCDQQSFLSARCAQRRLRVEESDLQSIPEFSWVRVGAFVGGAAACAAIPFSARTDDEVVGTSNREVRISDACLTDNCTYGQSIAHAVRQSGASERECRYRSGPKVA